MTTSTQTIPKYGAAAALGTKIPSENISDPGCYVCNWSGHLLRVPENGAAPCRSVLLSIVGSEPLFVTKISDDPYIPLTKAKLLAAEAAPRRVAAKAKPGRKEAARQKVAKKSTKRGGKQTARRGKTAKKAAHKAKTLAKKKAKKKMRR